MNTYFLLDNSALQRIYRSDAVLIAITDLSKSGLVASCLTQSLEGGYSARSLRDWTLKRQAEAASTRFLPPIPDVAAIALRMQEALFAAGCGRAVGVSDLQIAATAVAHSNEKQRVIVVHYDSDFETLAEVFPEFKQRWIVPRGTVD
ncbi:putative nucleic acid-binding protein [Arcanobacterium wilhelmae]|uniref:Nucleic acid-binding protein n=1 Tax=Arcanobacterium wilhelmae TaxID=1803177 RepID=A0ABT9NAX4_9ACTO|nr:hypothetical protein [Arcanobacterium wilhelmae]MDP9800869.1 putative nucleic acid-binding protein [Arcanobacterium wilhelmae]WFN90237.1 hypothetical protein P8A24_08650 [Arcanobacterium wilhelmae]